MTLALKDIIDFPGAKDYTHMSNTLLKKTLIFSRSIEVLHEAQFIVEAGSCNSFTREVGKRTCTGHSAYHHFQGVRLRQKSALKQLHGFGFCLSSERGFTGIMWEISTWGLMSHLSELSPAIA